MKCSEIFKSALKFLNEKGAEDENGDYAERAPYIIAAMCSEAAATDRRYRLANALPSQNDFSRTFISLDSSFPLSDRFSSAACFYLASLLIIDENEELADDFYEKYCDSISAISSEIPYSSGSTVNVYR
jgi:hypothetical protein